MADRIIDMTQDDHDGLEALSVELFGTFKEIPPTYIRELQRYLNFATAKLGLVDDSHHRPAYWIAGRSLRYLHCTGTTDDDLSLHHLVGKIIRLDDCPVVDLSTYVSYDRSKSEVASTGRRLVIGGIEFHASPGKFLPDKRAQIEQFIDAALTVIAS